MKKLTTLLVFCLALMLSTNASALPADGVNWIDESEAASIIGEEITEEQEAVVDALAYSLINYRLRFADVYSDDDIFFLPSDEEIAQTEEILQGENLNRLPRMEGLMRINVSVDPRGEDIELLPLRFCLDDGSETCENLMVWDTEKGNFTEVLELKNLVKERPTGVVLSFLLPPGLARKMKEQGYNEPTPVKIKSWIDVFDPLSESGMPEPVELAEFFMVALPEDLDAPEGTVQKSQTRPDGFRFIEIKREGKANGEIKINPVFTPSLELSLRPNKNPMKFYAGAHAFLGVDIFGMGEFKFCEAKAEAGTTVGDGEDSADKVDAQAFVKFLTFTLWEKNWSKEAKIEGNKTYRKEKGISKTIMVGWVPVTLEAGAAGELGVQWVFQMYGGGTLFQAKAGPFVDAGAYAKASVNLLVVQAGIKGQLSLIRDELWLDVRMNPWQKKIGGSVYNKIWGPGGSFGPFVKWWEINCEWKKSCKRCCWTSWCWWYPSCSSGWKEKYWPIASFSTFHRTDTIWSFGSWNDLQ